MTITGTLASDGRSLTNATVNVAGGQCAFATAAQASVQNFSSVTGSYVGTFSDAKGPVMNVTASLSQAPGGDTNGNFTLSGTASLGTNPCFVSPCAGGELAGLGRELRPDLHRQHQGQQRHGDGHVFRLTERR